eukprot:scaffold25193_cov29-Tisochrysis_lutea.AAC.8
MAQVKATDPHRPHVDPISSPPLELARSWPKCWNPRSGPLSAKLVGVRYYVPKHVVKNVAWALGRERLRTTPQ